MGRGLGRILASCYNRLSSEPLLDWSTQPMPADLSLILSLFARRVRGGLRAHPISGARGAATGVRRTLCICCALVLLPSACVGAQPPGPDSAQATISVRSPESTTTAVVSESSPTTAVVAAAATSTSVPTSTPVAGVTAPVVGQAPSPAVAATASAPSPAAATAAPLPSSTPAPAPTAQPPVPTPRPAVPVTAQSWTDRVPELQQGQVTDTVATAGEGVRLAGAAGSYASSGEYLSQVREAAFQFDNAVLSWNADAPPGTSLRFEVRVRNDAGWSGWYAMGEWRDSGGKSISGQSDARGRVDVDTLKLTSPASALQYRVKLTGGSAASPLLRQVSVAYSDMRRGLLGPQLPRVPAAVRDLDVPQHSQREEDPAYASEICSPTSLAMVMQYWGLKRSVAEVVAGVRDQTTRIYGNWPLNMAFAAANGFEARVERFYSVEQLEQEIAAGRPVAISIAYDPGELSGSPISSTDGHLIVVRGFTAGGDVIVNDPIAPNSKSVRLVYKRGELGRIWLRSGGIAYLLAPRQGGPPSR